MTSRAEVVKILKSFTTEELLLKVLPDLQFVQWDRIKRSIVSHKMSMSKQNIVTQIADKLWHLEDKNKIETLDHLYILGLIVHSSKYKWKAIELTGGEQEHMSSHELQSSIKKQLLREGTRGEVTVRLEAEMQWIRVVEKKLVRGRGIVPQRPVCAAVASGHCYMFLQGATVKEHILMCLVRALGRTGIKDCKLAGKDIKSLLTLLKAKEAKANNTKAVFGKLQYQKDQPTKSLEGINYMQNESRRKHCTEIFTNDDNEMPQLEEMALQVQGIGWNVDHVVPEMEGKPFSLEVTFRSTSIAQMFTEMATLGAMSTPLPEYARRLPILGRNNVKLKTQ